MRESGGERGRAREGEKGSERVRERGGEREMERGTEGWREGGRERREGEKKEGGRETKLCLSVAGILSACLPACLCLPGGDMFPKYSQNAPTPSFKYSNAC